MSDGVPQWVIGVVASLVGSTMLNLGMNMQKFSHMKNLALPPQERLPEYKQRLWVLGFTMFVVGNLGDFVALGFAAQSLIAPLGSVSLLSNAIIAPLVLGEDFTKKDFLATILIITGAIGAVVFGSKEETQYTLDELLLLYANPGFIAYAVSVVCVIASLYFGVKLAERKLVEFGGFKTQNPMAKRWKLYLPFGYASLGGIIGSQTVLTAKSAAELIKVSFNGNNQFIYLFTYVIIGVAAFTAVVQVHWINVGLKYFDALYIIPVFFVVWTVFSILGGNLYFDEFKTFSDLQAAMFALGVSMTCIGVFLLSDRNDKAREEEAKDEIELMEKNDIEGQDHEESEKVENRLNRSGSLGKSLHVSLHKPGSPLSPTPANEPQFQIAGMDDFEDNPADDDELQSSTMSLRQLELEDKATGGSSGPVVKPMLNNVSVVETRKNLQDDSPGLSLGSTFESRKSSTDSGIPDDVVIRKYYPGFNFDPEEQPRFYKRKVPLKQDEQERQDTISPVSPTPEELIRCDLSEAEYFSVVEQRIARFPPVSPERTRMTSMDYQDDFKLNSSTSTVEGDRDDSVSRARAKTLDDLMSPAVKTTELAEADALASQELRRIVDGNLDSPNLPGKAFTSPDSEDNNTNHSSNNSNSNRNISIRRTKEISDVELVQEPSPKNEQHQQLDYESDDEARESIPTKMVPSPPHLASLAKPLNNNDRSSEDDGQ